MSCKHKMSTVLRQAALVSAVQNPNLTNENRHQDDRSQTDPKDCQEHDDLPVPAFNPKNRVESHERLPDFFRN